MNRLFGFTYSKFSIFCLIVLVWGGTSFCIQTNSQISATEGQKLPAITIESPAFKSMGNIPSKYTCDSSNISPPLIFKNVPAQAKSLVLIVDDPDAPFGTWVHWVVYNLSAKTTSLKAGSGSLAPLPKGSLQGTNDFRKVSYGGPCPPSGQHRYFFKIYAINKSLNLPTGKTKAEVISAIKGHIIAFGELVGKYSKK